MSCFLFDINFFFLVAYRACNLGSIFACKVMDASIKFQQRSIAGDSIAGELQVNTGLATQCIKICYRKKKNISLLLLYLFHTRVTSLFAATSTYVLQQCAPCMACDLCSVSVHVNKSRNSTTSRVNLRIRCVHVLLEYSEHEVTSMCSKAQERLQQRHCAADVVV